MDDNILTDELLIDISKEVIGVTPKELSVFLGLGAANGEHAQFQNQLNLRAAYQSLLSQYVNRDVGGRGTQAAIVLGNLFFNKKMGACATIIQTGIRRPIISTFKTFIFERKITTLFL